jgi:hypothetical protein
MSSTTAPAVVVVRGKRGDVRQVGWWEKKATTTRRREVWRKDKREKTKR